MNLGHWSISITQSSDTVVFLGFEKYFEFSQMSTLASNIFVVVRFDTGEGRMRKIIESTQPLVLFFFGKDTEYGGTINVVIGVG